MEMILFEDYKKMMEDIIKENVEEAIAEEIWSDIILPIMDKYDYRIMELENEISELEDEVTDLENDMG